VHVPVSLEPASDKGRFQFLPPSDVRTVGSFPLDICVKPHIHIDVAVEMPKVCNKQSSPRLPFY